MTREAMPKEISCRITRTLLCYVRECNQDDLGSLLDDLQLTEAYLLDNNNWISHALLQQLYQRMIAITGDENAVFHMALASARFQSLGLLDRIARLLGNPRLIFAFAPRYNKLLKLNGDVFIHELGPNWAIVEDRYHHSSQKTRFDCDYTRGILAGIPTLFGMSLADVEEISCQIAAEAYGPRRWADAPTHGANGCLYRVRWQTPSPLTFWRRWWSKRQSYRQALEDLNEANRQIQAKYEEVTRLAADLEHANQALQESQRLMKLNTFELEASERRYRLLAENVTDIIWTLDLSTFRFDYVSPSVQRVRGFSPEEACALSLEETVAPDSLGRIAKALEVEMAREGQEGVSPERSVTIEIEHSCQNGSYLWAEVTATFIRDDAGRPIGILGVSRDIAERKQAEKDAAAMAEQLQQAQKMEAVGRLAAGVAHDLNNILSGLVGYPDLLLLEIPGESPLRDSILTIKQSGEKAAAIVQDLLSLARRGVENQSIVNLNRVVEEYLKSSEYAQMHRSYPHVTLSADLSDDLLNVKGSSVHLSKMIMNLVSNAAEAMPTGGRISLTTRTLYMDTAQRAYETIPEGEYVCLTVADQGVGISEIDQKRIFEPFYTKKSMGRSGSGLGMTVIWATVKDHGGYIDLISTEGEGTRFDIFLPATRLAQDPERRNWVLEDYIGCERILVVDDVAEQREIAVRMLAKLGYAVEAAQSGEAAVTQVAECPYDLLVLDMIMHPGIDGLETYRRVTARCPGQRAIIASGFSESDRVRELQALGAGAYVRKPYTLEKIAVAVRRELDRESAGDA